ncbi:hypothetical protein GCM10020366_08860 [Saccharopolyspora gregorii]
MLGVGTGEALNETAVTAREWPEFKERFRRFREAIDLIRTLWREDRVSYEGEYYRTSNATIYDRPEGGVPIYVAAGGPMVAKYAGRVGDGFICTSGKGMELYTDKLLPAVEAGAEAGGKNAADMEKMIEIKLSYDPDRERALQNTRFWAPLSLPAEVKHSLADPEEMEKAGEELPIEQVATRWIVASDPEEVLAEVKAYLDAGFDHLVFHAPGSDQTRFLESFGADVAPRIRELAG